MNSPMYFNDPEVKNQLLENGLVYVCRHRKRRVNAGVTEAREGNFKKYSEFARINVKYLGCIRHPKDLRPYISRSGFSSDKEWIPHIKDGLPAHLYKITVFR